MKSPIDLAGQGLLPSVSLIGTGAPLTENRSYLARILDVLDLVVTAEAPISATGVAAAGGMPASTVFRLTALLAERGLIERLPSGLLAPGSHLVRLGLRAMTRAGGSAHLEAAVRNIAADISESISAGLLIGDEIVLVGRQEPDFALRIVAAVGDVVTPQTSAMGKAILAFLPPSRQLSVLAKAVGAEQAPDLLNSLHDELLDVRECGFARDEERYAVGQRCRAVPLRHPSLGAYGALSAAGPTARFKYSDAEEAAGRLVEASHAILGADAQMGALA